VIRLLAVTPPTGPVDPDLVARWLDAGAGDVALAVLLREPEADATTLLDSKGRLGPLAHRCRRASIPILIGCDPATLTLEVSKRVEAETAGVQLRGDPSVDDLDRARRQLPDAILGRSCHGAPQSGHDRVDYTVLAPIFAPRTASPGRPKTPIGLDALRAWTADPSARVLALGGVDATTATACIAAGAHGLAAIRSFFGPPQTVSEDVRALIDALAGGGRTDVSPPTHR
jgi:thiamine monophosphate synthase